MTAFIIVLIQACSNFDSSACLVLLSCTGGVSYHHVVQILHLHMHFIVVVLELVPTNNYYSVTTQSQLLVFVEYIEAGV